MPGYAQPSTCEHHRTHRTRAADRAFSLVELLTVVTIIGVLITIVMPAISGARTAARKTASRAFLRTIETGLELFREATDDYPSSTFGPYYGDTSQGSLYGAQKLVRALMGREAVFDKLGSIPPKDLRKSVQSGQFNPDTVAPSQRIGPFVASANKGVRGNFYATKPPASEEQLPYAQWIPGDFGGQQPGRSDGQDHPAMFLDSFQFPVLYWKADPKGNFMMTPRAPIRGGGGRVDSVRPFYVHEDNLGFLNWRLGPAQPHPMREPGNPLQPDSGPEDTFTFTEAIHQHADEENQASGELKAARRPYNAESFLLITPGHDGLYGTKDDVRNFGP